MSDAETLAVYAARAGEYAELTRGGGDTRQDREAFLAALPPGTDPVLDWGAGPGHDGAAMVAAGCVVETTDATPEMVALQRAHGLAARIETFEALAPVPRYRGIWANFSLLHADAAVLADLILRAADALLPGGILHLGMKRGTGSDRDSLGRRYIYVEAEDLDRMTVAAGLSRVHLRHGVAAGLSGHPAGYVIHQSRKADA